MTHDECINLFQKFLARRPSSTELSFHCSKNFSEFENEIQSCREAESLRLRPLGYQIMCGNEMYCTPLNELGIRVSGRLLFCSSENNTFYNAGCPQYALLVTDRENRIVLNSNGHLTHYVHNKRSHGPIAPQHTPQYILGLTYFYNKIVKDSADIINITEPMFYLANVYSGWNIGHDLSATLYAIESYLAFCDANPYCSALRIVLSEDAVNKSKNISDLIELYIPRNRWFLAKSDVIYKFRYLDVPPTKHFSLLAPQGQKLLTEAVNLAAKQSDRFYMRDASPNPRNVILVKLEKHTAVRRSGVMPDWVISKILELWPGWVVLNPEELHFFKIAEILSQCERVIIGNGAIAFAHVGLINAAATIYVPFRDHRYTISPDQSIFFDTNGDQCFDPNAWNKFFERIAEDFKGIKISESLIGLSEYLERHYPGATYATIENVQMVHRRYGPGDTRTLWDVNGAILCEDHKGSHKNRTRKEQYNVSDWRGLIHEDNPLPPLTVDEALFLYNTDDNPGHTFTNVLRGLFTYAFNDLTCAVVIHEAIFTLSKYIASLIYLYVPAEKIVLVKSGQRVNCKTAHLYSGRWIFVRNYSGILPEGFTEPERPACFSPKKIEFNIPQEISFLIQSLEKSVISSNKISKHKKIALVKFCSDESTTPSRAFANKYREICEEGGYFVLNPAALTIEEVYSLVSYAEHLIISWGAIGYMASHFINATANVVLLCHEGYSDEWGTPWALRNLYAMPCEKLTVLSGLKTLPTERTYTAFYDLIRNG